MFTYYNDPHAGLVAASPEVHSESHMTGTTSHLYEPLVYLSSDFLSIFFSVTSDKQLRTTPWYINSIWDCLDRLPSSWIICLIHGPAETLTSPFLNMLRGGSPHLSEQPSFTALCPLLEENHPSIYPFSKHVWVKSSALGSKWWEEDWSLCHKV